jgi:hypothetical protein
MCIYLATIKNSEEPGSFGDVLNNLLSVNKLPCMNLGDFKPPDITAFNPLAVASGNQIPNSSVSSGLQPSSTVNQNAALINCTLPELTELTDNSVSNDFIATETARTDDAGEDTLADGVSCAAGSLAFGTTPLRILKRHGSANLTPKNIRQMHKVGNVLIEGGLPSDGPNLEVLSKLSSDRLLSLVSEVEVREFDLKRKLKCGVSPRNTRGNVRCNIDGYS